MRLATTVNIFVITLLLAGPLPGAAQETATAGEPQDPRLDALRDPFWPVGWEPPKLDPVTTTAAPVRVQPKVPIRWNEAKKHIRITGLSKNSTGEYFAILKKIGVVEAGDVIAVTLGELVYKWRVTKITSAGIVPEKVGVFPKNDAKGTVKP